VVAEAFLRELGPAEEVEAWLELAEWFLSEAKSYLQRGDVVQASEKLYNVAEECVKVLAQVLNLPEAAKARELGGWFTWLVDKAVRRASRALGNLG